MRYYGIFDKILVTVAIAVSCYYYRHGHNQSTKPKNSKSKNLKRRQTPHTITRAVCGRIAIVCGPDTSRATQHRKRHVVRCIVGKIPGLPLVMVGVVVWSGWRLVMLKGVTRVRIWCYNIYQ